MTNREAEQQHEDAKHRSAVPAQTVHEAILIQGREELARTTAALAWSGVAGGLSMSTSFLAEALLRAHLPDSHWTPLITKLGYPVGFLIVVLGRQQLFTENTLTAVLPLLHDKTPGILRNVARLWAVVFLANMIGAHLAAWFFCHAPAVQPEVHAAMTAIGQEAMRVSAGEALVRGIVAGWLIATVVWLTTAMDTAKVAAVAIPTYIVGLGAFTHIIAGSIEALFLVCGGLLSWPQFALEFMLPTLLGNSLGGVLLVAALNHAQVVAGRK